MKNVALLNNPVLEYRADSSVPVNISAVAERIAGVFGGGLRDIAEANQDTYYVPFAAVHEPLAQQVGLTGAGDVYGGIVREPQHADKAILHQLARADAPHPKWYSKKFANSLEDVVLPGFTTFTPRDTIRAFDKIRSCGLAVRFKDPSNTGGLGQYLVNDHEELNKVMKDHGDKFTQVGALLEADLRSAETVTVGYVNLAGETYTWHGKPYDVQHNGMTRFGGNELTVVRGGFKVLRTQSEHANDRLAIDQAERVYDACSNLGAVITRATFDAVQGVAHDGSFYSGITDPSFRPSASSAAEIRAIEAFAANSQAGVVKTRLTYDYAKSKSVDVNTSQELFVSHPRMNIIVELVDVA